MSEKRIKFTHNGHAHAFGNFGPGDIATCSEEQARHFVAEAMCAVYLDSPAAPPVAADGAAADDAEAADGQAQKAEPAKRMAKKGRTS